MIRWSTLIGRVRERLSFVVGDPLIKDLPLRRYVWWRYWRTRHLISKSYALFLYHCYIQVFSRFPQLRVSRWLLRIVFNHLRDLYEGTAGFHSFSWNMVKSPAYKPLVSLGEPILPFIFEGFTDKTIGGVMWFLVLAHITRVNPEVSDPVAPGWRGIRVFDTQDAWIQWGREHGYLQ